MLGMLSSLLTSIGGTTTSLGFSLAPMVAKAPEHHRTSLLPLRGIKPWNTERTHLRIPSTTGPNSISSYRWSMHAQGGIDLRRPDLGVGFDFGTRWAQRGHTQRNNLRGIIMSLVGNASAVLDYLFTPMATVPCTESVMCAAL